MWIYIAGLNASFYRGLQDKDPVTSCSSRKCCWPGSDRRWPHLPPKENIIDITCAAYDGACTAHILCSVITAKIEKAHPFSWQADFNPLTLHLVMVLVIVPLEVNLLIVPCWFRVCLWFILKGGLPGDQVDGAIHCAQGIEPEFSPSLVSNFGSVVSHFIIKGIIH